MQNCFKKLVVIKEIWYWLPPVGRSQEHISVITNFFLRFCIYYPVHFKHKQYILGSV